MKKILFSAVNLEMGGIEKALVMLLNKLASKYKITLVLEEKKGIFLDKLNPSIEILEFKPSNFKFALLRKSINYIKQQNFKRKYKNKFDFSCSFATYSRPGSFVARTASNNCILWCHMDYLAQYKGQKQKVKEFFDNVKFEEFKKLIFVSRKSKDTFLSVFPEMDKKVEHINNMIDYEEILNLAEESIPEKIEKNQTIFVNVSRHMEEQKRISRIIESAKILKNENQNLKIILVGEGPDTKKYKEMAEKENLKDELIFVGNKKNPYPYIKLADYLILTSDYEGSPVTFVEAFVLNTPIITTDVSGAEQVEKKYGIVVEKDVNKIAEAMNFAINNGYKIQKRFDAKRYNEEILNKLEKIVEGK